MKKTQNNSLRASALQISLSVALMSISAVFFATSFMAAPPETATRQQPIVVAQNGFYPPLPQQFPNLPSNPRSPNVPDQVVTVTAPSANMDTSVPIGTVITLPVTASQINASQNYIGFQADLVFDSAIAMPSPSGSSAQAAGLTVTANGWTVGSNVLNNLPGTLKTMRVSAFSNDGVTPLEGAGILYNIRWVRVSNTPGQSTTLAWGDPNTGNDFEFIDTDLNAIGADQVNGLLTITGPTPTPGGTATPTPQPTATPTPPPTATPTPQPTATPTPPPTASPTPQPTASPTPVVTPTASATPTPQPTASPTPVVTPTASATPTPGATASATPVVTPTATAEPTATATPQPTATVTPQPTATATPQATAEPTATPQPTATATPQPTATATPQPTATATPQPTATPTPQPTATPTTPPPTPTATPTPNPSCPAITVKPFTLPDGTVGRSYNKNISGHGGRSPYTFSISNGTLPTGLTLSPSGHLSGTPTAEGTFTFTVLATDSNGCTGKRQYTVNISCPDINVKPSHLSDPTVGRPYNKVFTASGGSAPYIFTISNGSLPTGLVLSMGGTLSGTPTEEGNFNFTVTATDRYGCSGKRNYTLGVKCPDIHLSPSNLPKGRVNQPYSKTITASGGNGGYTFGIEGGNLPPGLHLSSGGVLSGTPTSAGSFNFTIGAKDGFGCDGKRNYTLVIRDANGHDANDDGSIE